VWFTWLSWVGRVLNWFWDFIIRPGEALIVFVATTTFGTLQLSQKKRSDPCLAMQRPWAVLCCHVALLLVSVGSEVPKGWCNNTGDDHKSATHKRLLSLSHTTLHAFFDLRAMAAMCALSFVRSARVVYSCVGFK